MGGRREDREGYIRVLSVYLDMGFKTLTISEEAYRKLKRLKAKNESFTDVILKLGEGHGDILRYAGAWKDMTDEEATELAKTLRSMWSRWKPAKSA